jgi:hypothetical protein
MHHGGRVSTKEIFEKVAAFVFRWWLGSATAAATVVIA